MSYTFRSRALLIALAAALVAGCSKPPPPPAPKPASLPVKYEAPGLEPYKAGLAAVAAHDPEQAQSLFLDAVHRNTKLTEAWYELGRVKVAMAPAIAKTDELRALALFREGLQFEQQARQLMESGKFAVWTAEEADAARALLDNDLRDADHILADEDSLREALRLRVY
jgi:hypothetical protein